MKFSINFMKYRKAAMFLSTFLMIASVVLLFTKGLNLSIDFTGGNVIQVELGKGATVGELRTVVAEAIQSNAVIQEFGDSAFMIRSPEENESSRERIIEVLKGKYPEMVVLGFEKVGPVVGSELRREAFIGLSVALLAILIYITFRFQFRFAVVSVFALIHDALIVLGAFCIAGLQIDSTFIAAILTIVGYSLNNTIIILDRIRENWRELPKLGIIGLVNASTNQTLSRTINTTLTTLFPVISLYVWGGPVLRSFSFALLVGIVVGTYSSIMISTSLICEWWLKKPAAGK